MQWEVLPTLSKETREMIDIGKTPVKSVSRNMVEGAVRWFLIMWGKTFVTLIGLSEKVKSSRYIDPNPMRLGSVEIPLQENGREDIWGQRQEVL